MSNIIKPHSPGFPLYNKDHPLARGLTFGCIPGGMHRQDIVSGNLPQYVGADAEFNTRRSTHGAVVEATTNSTGGISYPLTKRVKTSADTNAITLMGWVQVDVRTSFDNIIGIPYRDTGSWASPWFVACLNRNASNQTASFTKGYNSSSRYQDITSGNIYDTPPTVMQQFCVTVDVADLNWYKEGQFFEAATLSGSQTYDFSNAAEISVQWRSHDPTGEGADGGTAAAYIWNRALSASEISQMYADPYIFIRQPSVSSVISVPAAFEVSLSSNIATGGADTTAQLTAPSGKTTGDFDTGRIWDDENGADSIDITTGNYTELEWCLQATADSEEVSYDFRIVKNDGSVLDTYTVTPQLTVSLVPDLDAEETISIGESLAFDISQAHAETVTTSEALAHNVSQALAETVTASESLAQNIGQGLAETVSTNEALVNDTDKALSETITISEAIGYDIGFAETISIGEALTEAVSVDLDETISLSESLAETVSQELSETITTNEALAEDVSKELSETITINEELDTPLSINPDETITLSESLAFVINRAFAETVTTGEALTKAISTELVDTITIGEDLATPLDLGLNETVTISESLAFVINQGLAETVTISELLSIPVDLDADETITIGEALAETVSKELSETITISEALSYDVGKNETISLSDSLVLDINQAISESITVTEALTKLISKELSDTITIGDSVSTPEGLNPAETITIVEALSNDVDKELAETLSLSESLALVISQALAEAVDINDILVIDSGVFNPAEERILITTTEDRILLTTTEDRILLTTTENRIMEVE
jgi:hypothetical protein